LSEQPELAVPSSLAGGMFANHVHVFLDPEYVTLDFGRLDPRDVEHGVVVARISLPSSCIIALREQLKGV
jgi:hypothetical protein